MKFGLSIFKEHFFHFDYVFYKLIKPFSLNFIEFKIETAFLKKFSKKIEGYVKKLKDFNKDIELSVHLPIEKINIAHSYKPLREAAKTAIKESIDIAIENGISRGVIHPPYNEEGISDLSNDEFLKLAFSSMVEISDYSKEKGFSCFLENKGLKAKREEVFSDLRYFDEAQKLFSGIVFDIGHLNLSGMHYEYFYRQFKERIKEIHLHKNSGIKDEHKPVSLKDDKILRFILSIKDSSLPVVLEHENIYESIESLNTLKEWLSL